MKAKQASGGKGRPQAAAGGAPAWQGIRTKGAKKVAGGSAARDRGAGAPGGAAVARESGGKRKAPGKRPAVASRKAQLQQQPGKGRQQKKRK